MPGVILSIAACAVLASPCAGLLPAAGSACGSSLGRWRQLAPLRAVRRTAAPVMADNTGKKVSLPSGCAASGAGWLRQARLTRARPARARCGLRYR